MRKPALTHLRNVIGPVDPVLLVALALALASSLYGIGWGKVECWNRDDMAMRGISGIKVGTYEKPPFHTYLNHVLVIWPLDVVEAAGKFLVGDAFKLSQAKLLQSRFLVVGMFLATVALAYWISHQSFGKNPARIIALLFATSAGFIEYDHFLSCDSPLLLWMVAAFFFARRLALYGDSVSYALTGFATGIATATKYNGLALGITIPIAHLIVSHSSGWKRVLLSPRFALGLVMVPLGFFAGAPAAPFQWHKFVNDFIYNAAVTPHYGGQIGGHGYSEFLHRLPEILGWPGTYVVSAAALASLAVVFFRRRLADPATICFALASSVFVLYFAQIGSFPRMERRFVLPAVPFLILACGPFFQAAPARVLAILLTPLLIYNTVCSLFVGYRFNCDPRLAAQKWIENRASIAAPLLIESGDSSPHWVKLPRVHGVEWGLSPTAKHRPRVGNVLDLRLYNVNGRVELFGKMFGTDSWVVQYARHTEGDPDESLYTVPELHKRNPDVLTVYSDDYKVPSAKARKYYADILSGKAGYGIVLDGTTSEPPWWIYPRKIDFLQGRMTILTRTPR